MSKNCDRIEWGGCSYPECSGDCPGRGNEFAIQPGNNDDVGFAFSTEPDNVLPAAIPYIETEPSPARDNFGFPNKNVRILAPGAMSLIISKVEVVAKGGLGKTKLKGDF